MSLLSLPSRRLEEAEELPRESLVLLEDTISRYVFLSVEGVAFNNNCVFTGTVRVLMATQWAGSYPTSTCRETGRSLSSCTHRLTAAQKSQEGKAGEFTLQLDATPSQGWNRVLVSLISWPGQLLSLYPCRRPKILARMLFWGFCL